MTPPPRLDHASNIYVHITAPSAPPSQTLSIALPLASSSSSSATASASSPAASATPPDPKSSSSAETPTRVQLEYVGPVGELQGEHIFAVRPTEPSMSLDSLKSDGAIMRALTAKVKGLEGVRNAKVLEEKQRAKRDL